MSEVTFIYDGNSIDIQAQLNEIVSKVIDKFYIKANIPKGKVYFLYDGKLLDENIIIEKIKINNENKRIIIVYNNDININNDNVIKKSNEIICPVCKKNILIEIDNYKIILKNCMNKHNKTISIEDFENSQLINLSKIICNIVKKIIWEIHIIMYFINV